MTHAGAPPMGSREADCRGGGSWSNERGQRGCAGNFLGTDEEERLNTPELVTKRERERERERERAREREFISSRLMIVVI